MGKVVCLNCGASNEEEAKFCSKCGSELTDDYSLDKESYNEDSNIYEVKTLEEVKERYCTKCGSKLHNDSKFCSNCGQSTQSDNNDDLIHCPKCGSTQISFVRYEDKQNYNLVSGICGLALCGPLGLLCGIKNKDEGKTVRKCQKCGHEF